MEIKARHLILMLLNVSGGEIDSKTKIQKEMYFLSLLMKKDFGFKAHYYGPYSPMVEQGLDELIGAGFVDMERKSFGIINRGFEVQRYDFFLTDEGKEMANYLMKENSQKYSVIEEFVGNLKSVGNPDYLNLSIAAKTYFILHKEKSSMKNEEIRKKAKSLDWEMTIENVNKAVEILQKLNFVRMN